MKLGFEPPIIKVQVKSDEGAVGDPTVSALYGKVGDKEFGLLVTLGPFTKQAETFAAGKSNLRLISGDELVELDSGALPPVRPAISGVDAAQASLHSCRAEEGRGRGLADAFRDLSRAAQNGNPETKPTTRHSPSPCRRTSLVVAPGFNRADLHKGNPSPHG